MAIPIDQAIAYMITILSVTLFIIERRRNSKASVYMALQGMLKAAYEKYRIHQANWGLLLKSQTDGEEREVSFEEHKLYIQLVALDYDTQVEQILGIMKSLEIREDSIFNKNDFTGHEAMMKEHRERKQQNALGQSKGI